MIKPEFLMWSVTWHNFNVILLNCGMNIQIRKIRDKSSHWHKNNNTSSILTKQSCLFQNNMAKESYPYKIIWSGYAPSSPHKIFKSCTTLMTSQAIVSYFWCSQTFSTFTQYMSVSHGYSTIGGIEYDGGGWVEKTKRKKVSHRRD